MHAMKAGERLCEFENHELPPKIFEFTVLVQQKDGFGNRSRVVDYYEQPRKYLDTVEQPTSETAETCGYQRNFDSLPVELRSVIGYQRNYVVPRATGGTSRTMDYQQNFKN